MPAFHTANRYGFNSRNRDQNITRQVFTKYGTTSSTITLSRSSLAEDSDYNVYVSSKQTSSSTLSNPLITKFNKKCQKIWEVGLETTFLTDVYRIGSKLQIEPPIENVSIDVNSLSYITFWYSKTTSQQFSPSPSLLGSASGSTFWAIINNDPTRIYKLQFDRSETDSGNYYRQGISKSQFDAQKFINDVNNRIINVGDTISLLYQLSSFNYEEIPIAVDRNDDLIVGFKSIRDSATILYSTNLNGSSWTNYCGSSSSVTPNTTAVLAPDGSNTATRIIRNSNTSCNASTAWGRYWNTTSTVSSGVNYTLSIYVRGAVGGETVTFGIADGNTSDYTLTTEWQKITYTANATSNSRGLQIYSTQPNITFYFWGARIERTEYIDNSRRLSLYLFKLDKKNGQVKWSNEYYLNSDSYISNFSTLAPSDIRSIIVDNSNNLYVAGSAFASQGPNSSIGNNYGFVLKLSKDGNILWKKSLYASQSPIPESAAVAGLQISSLALTQNNNFLYASGGSYTTAGAGPCLYRINTSTGNVESGWPKIYNLNVSLNEFMFITEVGTDSENNVYGIIGKQGQPESSFDYSVIKFDSAGNLLWANRYDTNDTTESGNNLLVDRDDVIYVAGRCDTVLNERPGVLALNTDQTTNSFRRIRYRTFPFADETSISLLKQKCFTSSKDRNRHTFLLNQIGLNGFVLAMIQKEKFAIGTYENSVDRYVISGSSPIITDVVSAIIDRSYSSTYQNESYLNKMPIYSRSISPLTNYYVISSVLVPQ
jgi:hypothetical protein